MEEKVRIKIAIADDEVIERSAFKLLIQNYFPQLDFVGEADNGVDMIALVNETSPDIIFMDIRMPRMDGIKAMCEIKKSFPGIKIIISSCYDYFEYAQQAVAMGARDYLLKPVTREKMLAVLKDAVEEVQEVRSREKEQEGLKKQIQKLAVYLEQEIIYMAASGNTYYDLIKIYASFLEVRLEHFYCMILKSKEDKCGNEERMMEEVIKKRGLFEAVNQAVKKICGCVAGIYATEYIVLLIPVPTDGTSQDREWIMNLAGYLANMVKSGQGIAVRIGISNLCDGPEQAYSGWEEAQNVVEYGYGDFDIACIGDIMLKEAGEQSYPYSLENELCRTVLTGDRKKSDELLQALMKQILGGQNSNVSVCRHQIAELLMSLNRFLRKYYNHFADSPENIRLIEKLYEQRTVKGLMSLAERYIKAVMKYAEENRQGRIETVVDKAMQYIDRHYDQDISLDMVSEMAEVSPFYLSKIFKQQTGQNFVEYITETRIAQAKQRLISTGKSIKEIARESGFNNQNYFNKVFKKCVGLSPGEFREREGQ